MLRAMKPLKLADMVLGQYEGYTFDPDVPDGSSTETFAQAAMQIDNSRWRGVPFIVKCAKASNERKCEIRVQLLDMHEGSSALLALQNGRHSVRGMLHNTLASGLITTF